MRKFILLLLITSFVLPIMGWQAFAQEDIGIPTTPLNVRSTPNGARVGGVDEGVEFLVEGRNAAGDWVLGHTRDGATRGWVASEYLNRNFEIANLRVTDEVVGASVEQASQQQENTTQQENTAAPAGSITGVTGGELNLRNAPNGQLITTLPTQTTLIVEGRNSIGDWIKVTSTDGSLVGWVASRYVSLNGTTVQGLAVVGVSPVTSGNNNTTYTVPSTEPTGGAIQPGAPVISGAAIQNARSIYAKGRALGNRGNVFTVVGDSITSEQPFLKGFTFSPYDLGDYGYLQETIDFFSVPPRDGVPTSFANHSIAASPAFSTGAVLDITWSDPNLCEPNEAPLLCEYRITKPSVAIIMLGSIDVRFFEAATFEDYLDRVLELTLDQGIIPVLTTFPNGAEYYPDKSAIFNDIIRNTAASMSLPLIELRAPLMALTNHGVGGDQFHLSQDGEAYIFDGHEQYVGVTMRNVLTLQALDTLMRNVLR